MKREKYEPVLKNISYFIKWAEGAIVIGIVSGCIGTAFHFHLRHHRYFWILPVSDGSLLP